MKDKNLNKFNFSELKFTIFILQSVEKNILLKFKNWTDKYDNFIKYNRIEKIDDYIEDYDNYLITEDDIKYFTNLKKKFKKYINASFKIRENEIIYLNDNKILDYKYKDSEKKIRPYFVSDPNTKSNHKVVIFQISSRERSSLKKIEIKDHICYLNSEEPITVNKFKLFKIILESNSFSYKIKLWCKKVVNMKYTLITGASSGIGKALAEKFAQEGHNLIIVARREELLNQIKNDLETKYKIKVIVYKCDLSDSIKIKEFYQEIKKYSIETFINNAGFGDINFTWEADINKTEKMLDLNIKALTLLSMMFIKDNLDNDVQLINVSSVGGYKMLSSAITYCATKVFVSAWTENVAKELKRANKKIKVKILAPAATKTEFGERAIKKSNIGEDWMKKISQLKVKEASELADDTYNLYKSDKIIGMIGEDNKLKLSNDHYINTIWI
ncbi:/ / putative oxidoreductase / 225391:226740 Reverse [Candidatus Hepatoplasma crinochetorum]|uniref:/ / putative oxidoreductase / 225391:226740 Reverse n=1 Tax=Candidatus Hepatoplasma crinochetorum TaxID=295596 RepID=A0A0G7ZMC4_9MOLU|nr:/ / putative oxidoreductase / 225391:226740 Reverse [Candidatus Hepatoplasma crinochetorum]